MTVGVWIFLIPHLHWEFTISHNTSIKSTRSELIIHLQGIQIL